MSHGRTVILTLALAVACGRDVVFVDPPLPKDITDTTSTDTTGTDTTGTDTTLVQRAHLQLTVTIAAPDSALAAGIGMATGRLVGAEVTVRRGQGLQAPQVGTTDSSGQVSFAGLLTGYWSVTVRRPLSAAERAALDSTARDVTGFGGAQTVEVVAPASTDTVETYAGRQGTLVISEAYLPKEPTTGYQLGQYIEVHNNAFETLYLDGTILGLSLVWVYDAGVFPCSASVRWREDAEGIWSHYFWAFPGTGHTYPLAPGASAVIATDAIDHRVANPGLLDLSGADFEFLGSNDVDNPAVPNMQNSPGWSDPAAIIGHGPWWVSLISVYLSQPFDPDSLAQDNLPVHPPLHFRVPRDKILDVLTSGSPAERQTYPYCANFVHPSFDGRYAELVDGSMTHSLARRGTGFEALQRTRVSAADFAHEWPSPGRVP